MSCACPWQRPSSSTPPGGASAWLLPVGILLAMPVIWWGSLVILAAAVALRREVIEARFDRLLAEIEVRYHQRLSAQRAATSSS